MSPADLASVWALPLLSLRSIPRKRKLIQDQRNTGTGIGVHTQHRKFFSDQEKRQRADTKKNVPLRIFLSHHSSQRETSTHEETEPDSPCICTYIATYLTFFMDTEFEAVSHMYYVFWWYCCGQVHSPYILPTRTGSSWRISYSPEWIQQSAYYTLVVHNWRGR